MKFIIEQAALKKELEYVAGIVEKRATIPVLSNILIKSVGDEKIRITGTDLDITIRCEAPARVETQGVICVQAKKLLDIVRLLPDAEISFEADANAWVNLKCGKSKFRIAGVSDEHFPEVPEFRDTPLQLPSALFNSFIQRTSYAITQEQSRFTLSGAKFLIVGDEAKMIATDGHRLAYASEKVSLNASLDVLIPKKALSELVKISRESAGNVSFGEDANHIYFEVGGRLLIARKLTGSFPNYEMVIPKNNDKVARFDVEELKQALRRVALMADERTQSIKFQIKNKEIVISSHSSEDGNADESVPTDYTGEETIIGFNWRYVQDFLLSTASDNVSADDAEDAETSEKSQSKKGSYCLSFKDGNGQVMFYPENRAYLSIVMPLRV